LVPLDRTMAISYRLSVVTMCPFAAVWSQFSMQSFSLSVAVSPKRWQTRPRLLLMN